MGVANYGESSRLWSTPAHTISAASFREPFYLTATTDVQKADLRLLSSLVVEGSVDLEASTRRVLGDVAGMAGELTSAEDKDRLRSNLLRRAQPTTRSHLIAQLDDALARAEAVAQTQGRVLFVFYMSAHGWIGADGRTYLLPSNADYERPSTWIDQQEIMGRAKDFLARSRTDGRVRRAALVFDNCRNARGDMPQRMAAGAPRSLVNAVVAESTSPGNYAWHWTLQKLTSSETRVLNESRWGFPFPPPKAQRGKSEEMLASNMSVVPMASSCAMAEHFASFASGKAEAGRVLDVHTWLLHGSRRLAQFTADIPEVRETGREQDMQVQLTTTQDNIPMLEAKAK